MMNRYVLEKYLLIAATAFLLLSTLQPLQEAFLGNLGWVTIQKNENSHTSTRAEWFFQKILISNPNSVPALAGLAQARLAKGDIESARNTLMSGALSGTERGDIGWQALGWWVSDKDEELAIEAWQRSGFWNDDRKPLVFIDIAIDQWKYGNRVLAFAMLRHAATRSFSDSEYYRNLGVAFENVAIDMDTAIEQYKRVVNLSPESEQDWTHLATLCRQTKKWTCAREAAETALVLRPDLDRAMYELGQTLSGQGQSMDAIGRLENFIERYPQSHESLIFLGSLYLEKNRVNDAERVLIQALSLGERAGAWEAWAYSLLGKASLNNQDFEQSEHYLLSAVTIASEEPIYLIQLGDFYVRLERLEQAEDIYYQTLLLDKITPEQREYVKSRLKEIGIP